MQCSESCYAESAPPRVLAVCLTMGVHAPDRILRRCRVPAQFLGQAAPCGCACHQQYLGAWLAGESSPLRELHSVAANSCSPESCTAVFSPCASLHHCCNILRAFCWAGPHKPGVSATVPDIQGSMSVPPGSKHRGP